MHCRAWAHSKERIFRSGYPAQKNSLKVISGPVDSNANQKSNHPGILLLCHPKGPVSSLSGHALPGFTYALQIKNLSFNISFFLSLNSDWSSLRSTFILSGCNKIYNIKFFLFQVSSCRPVCNDYSDSIMVSLI